MSQRIIFSNIKPGYDESHIHRLLSYANYNVMATVNNILTLEDIEYNLINACEWFATSLYVTYHSDKIKEILNTIEEDSEDILQNCENDADLPRTVAYDIGTNSEQSINYSLTERIILLVAAAKRLKYKFDFSWNL